MVRLPESLGGRGMEKARVRARANERTRGREKLIGAKGMTGDDFEDRKVRRDQYLRL